MCVSIVVVNSRSSIENPLRQKKEAVTFAEIFARVQAENLRKTSPMMRARAHTIFCLAKTRSEKIVSRDSREKPYAWRGGCFYIHTQFE